MEVLVLADDLTGALEVGAKFARKGIESLVTTGTGSDANVLVVDTETRHLSPQRAAEAMERWTHVTPRLIIKKTDSTLRGNIAAELEALAKAYPARRIAFVPAYPELGRTVKNGLLYVYGVPVHLTSFAHDPVNPVNNSCIASILGDRFECDVFDGLTNSDIDHAAEKILADPRYFIIAGPGAIADAVASRLDLPQIEPSPLPELRKCLVVNGSLHEASLQQVKFARQAGCAGTAESCAWKIIDSALPLGTPQQEVKRDTIQRVRTALATGAYDGLVIFGGDTAFWIMEDLGCSVLLPLGEVLPGIPVSRLPGSNMYLVTKAGGFGQAHVLCQIKDALNERNP